jgi:hypothetical protein
MIMSGKQHFTSKTAAGRFPDGPAAPSQLFSLRYADENVEKNMEAPGTCGYGPAGAGASDRV